MNINFSSLGVILALVVLILTVVLAVLSKIDPVLAILIGGLALARLLP